MPSKITHEITLLMFVLAGISGGLGGCAMAQHQILRGVQPRLSYVFAYAIIGIFFGLLGLCYGAYFGGDHSSIEKLIGQSLLAGALGSVVLASSNISARWILKRLGVEVEVTLRRTEPSPIILPGDPPRDGD